MTHEKLRAQLLSISLADLPATVRDAIIITRRLGLRYIWIDALCIIQDSSDGADWLQESAKMYDIYGNAYLTIAAAGAANASDGIFGKVPDGAPQVDPYCDSGAEASRHHKRRHRDRFACQLSFDGPDGSIGSVRVSIEDDESGWASTRDPLHQRAWTLQERLLSPRVLIYRSTQLAWDCWSTVINANGPLNPGRVWSDTANRDLVFWGLERSPGITPTTGAAVSSSPNIETPPLSLWSQLVESYAYRRLTLLTDRLPALSALARLYHIKTGDVYLAGMWQKDLAFQLSWRSYHLRGGEPLPSSRVLAYRAPSWSWASREGSVRFDLKRPVDSLVILEAVIYPLSSADPFGQVIGGHLTIRAPLKLADSLQCNDDGIWWLFSRSGSATLDVGATGIITEHSVGGVYADVEEEFRMEMESGRDVWCLQLSMEYALLLVVDYERYRRIGYFYISEQEFFKDACLRTITII
jgi:Heterokaryon incompatibility protein (HET)